MTIFHYLNTEKLRQLVESAQERVAFIDTNILMRHFISSDLHKGLFWSA